jgi:hypothetical protein
MFCVHDLLMISITHLDCVSWQYASSFLKGKQETLRLISDTRSKAKVIQESTLKCS